MAAHVNTAACCIVAPVMSPSDCLAKQGAAQELRLSVAPGAPAASARLLKRGVATVRCQAADANKGSAVLDAPAPPLQPAAPGPSSEERFRSNYVKKDKDAKLGPLDSLGLAIGGVRERLISEVFGLFYKAMDRPVNGFFAGNFKPVDEIDKKTPVKVVAGAVPKDFPAGVYIRNGPNPLHGGKFHVGPFGFVGYHMFEGDGMLHGTYFKDGEDVPTFLNRYIGTMGYKVEKERGKPVWANTLHGDSKAVSFNYFINSLRFGKINKPTCNTHTFMHGGKYYATAEGDVPHEIDLSTLTTIREYGNFDGAWNRPVNSHPTEDPLTGELVIFSFAAAPPYYMVGVVSADGERLVHTGDVGFDYCIFSHELLITLRYNIVLDFPLTVSVDRLMTGGHLLKWEGDRHSRLGIFPRYGDKETAKWFPVETCYGFHMINQYEEGDEVVIHGVRTKAPLLPCPEGMTENDWFTRGIQPVTAEDAVDPEVDGVLFSRVHEWRCNMVTGEMQERALSDMSWTGEYPTINRSWVAIKNRYAYMAVTDIKAASDAGAPKFNRLGKLTLPSSRTEELKHEFHVLERHCYASEPFFVERPDAKAEDDGWVLAYVHNEATNVSYLYIVDAQNFSDSPVAKLQLPNRVPYGYHGNFFYEREPLHQLKRKTLPTPSAQN